MSNARATIYLDALGWPELRKVGHLLVVAQIVVATLMLSLGEGSPFLLILTTLALAASTYVTDVKKLFAFSQPVADIVALCVMMLSVLAALRTDRQGLLVLVANLQAYLQYVLLFQSKTVRVYWQLVLLSLGEVAIASTLLPGPSFGFLLLAYLLLGVAAMAVLLLSNESRDVCGESSTPKADDANHIYLRGNAVSVAPRSLWISLLPTVSVIGILAVVNAGVIFFVLPRWATSTYETTSTEPIRTVGFSNTVILGELGEVVNDPEVVMRVTFYRGRSNRPFRLAEDPLFRGSVVTHYENRIWTQPRRANPVTLPTKTTSYVTRQRISIEPLNVSEVFHVAPAVSIDQPDSRLHVDPGTYQVFRSDELRARQAEFEIGSLGIRGNKMRDIIPNFKSSDWSLQTDLVKPFSNQQAERPFPILSTLADDILSNVGIDPSEDPVAAARALSDYFHLSGDFFYTLDPQERDPTLDPLEDFVSVHRGGHCEYFAGALVMMLRSQGIPARMVIGFKGGEWNDVGQYYQVQQLHAHAWVEAFLAPSQIPPDEFAGEAFPSSAWLVLDPTEGTREAPSVGSETLLGRIRHSIDYARVLWINYVASLNEKRQQQGIYEPLAAGVEAAFDNLTSVQIWQERLRNLEESRLGRFWRWYRRHWFSWRGGLVAIAFSLLMVVSVAACRAAWHWMTERGWLGRKNLQDSTPVLEIYRRLEATLERAGFQRDPAQTASEFAAVAGGHLAANPDHRPVAQLPSRIVDVFYRIRFGGRNLDKPEADAVEHALTELELALGRSR